MKLPRLPVKWIRGRSAGEVIVKFITVLGLVFGLVFMAAVLQLAPDGPDRYCDCPDRDEQRERARRSTTEREAVELQAELERRAEAEATRIRAAERVRQALKAWEREQAEREAIVRAVLGSKEVVDAAAEPAAEVAPR